MPPHDAVLSSEAAGSAARPAGRRALLLVNRESGRGAAGLAAATALLERTGFAVRRYDASAPGETAAAIRGNRDAADLVVIAGGDGTVHAALEALLEAGLPLGILPAGTGDDLARALDLPRVPSRAAEAIAAGRARLIDLGRVNGTLFCTVACIGLGTDVLHYQTPARRRLWRSMSYLVSALQAYFSARPFRARITCDGEAFELSALHIAIGNGRYYGGGLIAAEGARIDDGRLDLACIEAASFWRLLAVIPGLFTGRFRARGPVLARRGREIEVWTERPLPVRADGEITGQTPARFGVLPGALPVFAPDGAPPLPC